jgi:uncharacterized protein (TIGR00255 family)
MIQSMTGYGKSTVQLESGNLTIEIKSLNSKNIDLNTRITNSVKPKELLIRKHLSDKLKRGKVDFLLYLDSTNNKKKLVIKYYSNKYVYRSIKGNCGRISCRVIENSSKDAGCNYF